MNIELLHNYFQDKNLSLPSPDFDLGTDTVVSATVTVLAGGDATDNIPLQGSDDGIVWLPVGTGTISLPLGAAPFVDRMIWSGNGAAICNRYGRLLITTGSVSAIIINVSVSSKPSI